MMTTDPKDAEIARLTAANEQLRYIAFANQTRAEKAEAKVITLTEQFDAIADHRNEVMAERDAKSKWLAELLAVIHRDGGHYQAQHGDEKSMQDAHLIVAGLFSSRDAALAQVAGAYEAAAQITENDKTLHEWEHTAAIRALTPADALAALSRRDAQMRAEGMRKAAEVAYDVAHRTDDISKPRDAVLAAAEKEAGVG